MCTHEERRKSLLTYWTARYLVTLCIGLLVIGVISTYWIKYSETQRRLDIMKLMAEEIADRVVDSKGNLLVSPYLLRIVDRRQRYLELENKPLLFILDQNKNIVFGPPGPFADDLDPDQLVSGNDDQSVKQVTLRNGARFYAVTRNIESNKRTVGWVILLSPEKGIARNPAELQLLFIMLGSLALLGWVVIYLLTRKLAMPIKGVANAAKQIVAGNYDVHLDKNIKEQELYELIHSFKNMADRLGQLERTRTELLAGVTHELKTPVTSISGLIQAVKDGVVTGDEAAEFLEICTKETNKLQKMVEDLLDFNTFAVGEIKIRKEQLDMNHLIQEIVHQWRIAQDDESFQLRLDLPEPGVLAATDPLRVQQIFYNLLNNAKQAIRDDGLIEIAMRVTDDQIRMDIRDNGAGIPLQEQPLIFEKFFRGEQKKHRVRGLGLGLPFSRLMAQALGGDLYLKESSEAGTTFTLVLPRE